MGLLRGMLGLALGAGDESSGSSSSGGRRRIVRCYCRICGESVNRPYCAGRENEGNWIETLQMQTNAGKCGKGNHIPEIVYNT